MRRKRYQKGSVRPRKHGRNKVWVAQWWVDGKRRSKVLGRCADMPKSEAEARMALSSNPPTWERVIRKSPYTRSACTSRGFSPFLPAEVEGVDSNDY